MFVITGLTIYWANFLNRNFFFLWGFFLGRSFLGGLFLGRFFLRRLFLPVISLCLGSEGDAFLRDRGEEVIRKGDIAYKFPMRKIKKFLFIGTKHIFLDFFSSNL